MEIVDKILEILKDIDDIETVIYDSAWSTNVRIDRKPLPGAVLYLVNDWQIDLRGITSKEQADINIFFFDKANYDAKGEEKDIIVNNMNEIAKQFLYKLLADKSLRIIDDTINLKSVWGQFDKFVVGCSLKLKVEERQGSCLYIEPAPTPTPTPDQETENETESEDNRQ